MSTRSFISLQIGPNKYRTIYCHFDGYLSHNGAILLDYYKTKERVEELLNLGNLSSLAEHTEPNPNKVHSFDYDKRQDDVCVAYSRERGDDDCEAFECTKEKLFENDWIEYFYIFTLDNKWKYYDCNHNALNDVQEDLNLEYEEICRERPFGYYGDVSAQGIDNYINEQKRKKQSNSDEEM